MDYSCVVEISISSVFLITSKMSSTKSKSNGQTHKNADQIVNLSVSESLKYPISQFSHYLIT